MSEQLNELKIEVTHRCPLACVHCSSNAGIDNVDSITLEKCLQIIDQAAALGAKEIAFSGGEPLIWCGLKEAIDRCFQCGIQTTIYTSGNCDDIIGLFGMLSAAGLHRAVFSIYSPIEQDHIRITRKRNSFRNTITAIRTCKQLGIIPEIHFVALASNYKMLPSLVSFAASLGIDRVSVLRFVPQGRGVLIEKKDTLTKQQNLELIKMIKTLRNEGHQIRTGSPFNVLMLNQNPQCMAAQDRMIIAPDLSIYPCDAFKQIPADHISKQVRDSSLKNSTVADCWNNSSYLNAVRHAVKLSPVPPCSVCASYIMCKSGCLAQRFLVYNSLAPSCDPACLMRR